MGGVMVTVQRRSEESVAVTPLSTRLRRRHGAVVMGGALAVQLVRSWLSEPRRSPFDRGARLDTRLTAAQFDRVVGYAKKGGAK